MGWEWIFVSPVLEFICYLCKVSGFLDERDGFLLEKGMCLMGGLSVLKDISRTLCPVIDDVCYKDFLLENKKNLASSRDLSLRIMFLKSVLEGQERERG